MNSKFFPFLFFNRLTPLEFSHTLAPGRLVQIGMFDRSFLWAETAPREGRRVYKHWGSGENYVIQDVFWPLRKKKDRHRR